MKKLIAACLLIASSSAFCAPGEAVVEHKGNVSACEVSDYRNPNQDHYFLRNCTNNEVPAMIQHDSKRKNTDRYTLLPVKVYGQREQCWTEGTRQAHNFDGTPSQDPSAWEAHCFYKLPKQQ